MALKARYDPREDRMLLLVTGPEGERRFWITRRLWLGIYRQLARLAPGDEAAARPPAASGRPAPIPPEEAQHAALLQTVHISGDGDGIKLVFATGKDEDKLTINVAKPGFAQFKRTLEMQAERAGWDSASALERLDAQAAASAALQRAKK
jgi:hypothetical protein